MLSSVQQHCTLFSPLRKLASLFFFFSLLLFTLLPKHAHLITTTKSMVFIYSGCSQDEFLPNSPFENNLNSFLSSVVSSASQAPYNSFAIGNETTSFSSSSQEDEAIYGLYQCRGHLNLADCSKCIQTSVAQIGLVCSNTYGASLQLQGCFLRYEHSDFLGKLDTSLRYNKCSKKASDDAEFFRRRDDVLSDMEGAIGFRVSSSALVEGFAQCLGDLSPSDCSACLSEAVVKLKSLCGSSEAADVFLAQCYARFWSSGYYGSASDSSNEDEVGKTVAIIVGVLAGVAVVIVLLSLCRKSIA